MIKLKLYYMNQNEAFPFFVQVGQHDVPMEMHTHEDFSELVIVTDGSATHIVEDESFRIKKGDVFVVGGGLTHGYKNVENFRIYNIMFRVENLTVGNADLKKSRGFHSLFIVEPTLLTNNHSFGSRLSLSPDDFIPIKKLVNMMLDEYDGGRECRETMIMSYFMTLVVILSRLYEISDTVAGENIMNIANAAAYMENHYDDLLPLGRLAEISHYSVRHFIRLFKEAYRATPQRYLLEIRIKHAELLLSDSDMTVTEIAQRCGFSDSNYFSSAFRRHTGKSPLAYRRCQRSDEI